MPEESLTGPFGPERGGIPTHFDQNNPSAMAKPIRIAFLLLFLLLVLAVRVGRTQVAVPDFSPASPRLLVPGTSVPDANFVLENPGALQWGAPSRFGLGQIQAEAEEDNGLGTTTKTKYDGYHAGLRWVKEAFTLAGEIVNVESSDNAYKASVTNGAVAFPVGKVLAVGIGLDTADIDDSGASDTRRGPTLGISFNLDDRFFIGLAMGREFLTRDPGFGGEFSSDRAVQSYGIGFRKGGAGTAIHLEFYVIARDPHEDGNGFEFDEQDQSHIVIELNWSSILLSAHWVDFKLDNAEGASQVAALGWAPKKGLALVGQIERTAAEDQLGAKTDALATSVALAYQF
jgi:hypothetical protein